MQMRHIAGAFAMAGFIGCMVLHLAMVGSLLALYGVMFFILCLIFTILYGASCIREVRQLQDMDRMMAVDCKSDAVEANLENQRLARTLRTVLKGAWRGDGSGELELEPSPNGFHREVH
jgi:hypothetical protein